MSSNTPWKDPEILTNFGAGNDFGHADYQAARDRGFSNERLLDFMERNPSKLKGKNVIGGGGLYDEVKLHGKARNHNQNAELERQHSTEYGWIGNKNTYDKKASYGPPKQDPTPEYQQAKQSVADYKERVYSGDFLKGDSNGWWGDDDTTESDITTPIEPNVTEQNDTKKSFITKRHPEGFMRDFMKKFKLNKD